MKKLFFCAVLLCMAASLFAQTTAPKILYGKIQRQSLLEPPFNKWFDSIYAAYQPNTEAIPALKKQSLKGISIEIFFGTWCGDSRRELPRFMRVLDEMNVDPAAVNIIAVGDDSLYKQSPQHEEAGKGVFRVPVFIVYRNGKEVNRINEYPSVSLEKDLLSILSGETYNPNYKSFATVKKWLAENILTDKNSSLRGLAMQVKHLVAGERELNSLGYVLLEQGKKEEALKIFQINAILYPESALVLSSLGEGYYKNGDSRNAVANLEKSLELNKDPQMVKEILKILYEVKGLRG